MITYRCIPYYLPLVCISVLFPITVCVGSRDRHVIDFCCCFLLVYLQDRNNFTLKLEDTENWLYEDGEDQPKQVYVDKLAELRVSDS